VHVDLEARGHSAAVQRPRGGGGGELGGRSDGGPGKQPTKEKHANHHKKAKYKKQQVA
jgi:hypothetical protein